MGCGREGGCENFPVWYLHDEGGRGRRRDGEALLCREERRVARGPSEHVRAERPGGGKVARRREHHLREGEEKVLY